MDRASHRVFAVHPEKETTTPLASRLQQLLDEQKQTWHELKDGYDALRTVKSRQLDCNGFSITLQFNPGRIKSTGASLDDQSLRSRKCFLCVENLPDAQRGILYRDRFLILCNPAPIFDRHFTVSHVEHRAQSIEAFPDIFLDLASEVSPAYSIFYNGPRCGASAPDHLHYQVCPSNALPIEFAAADDSLRERKNRDAAVRIDTLRNCGREVIVIESETKEEAEKAIRRLLQAMRKTLNETDEPMVNVHCSFLAGTWRLIVFPRSKHRPDVYYRTEKDRILISPATVDLGGLVVTPLEKDFVSVDAQRVIDIFREVSLDADTIKRIIAAWNSI